uniref:P-selectin glycoprotein ligand 1 n=1 Tax=Pavo cristatus TaxID=9049 RepID=A0A8C9F094_PAVCR
MWGSFGAGHGSCLGTAECQVGLGGFNPALSGCPRHYVGSTEGEEGTGCSQSAARTIPTLSFPLRQPSCTTLLAAAVSITARFLFPTYPLPFANSLCSGRGALFHPPPVSSPGHMALGHTMLLALLLSTLPDCSPRPTEPGLQWVWGAAEQTLAEHPLPSRRRRADAGPHSTTVTPVSNETTSPGHDMLMITEPGNTTGQPKPVVVNTTGPLGDSPEHHALLGTEVDNTSSQALVLTTVGSLNESNSLQTLVLVGTEPPTQPGNTSRQAKASPVTTADPSDETSTPETIVPLGTELPPKMGDSTSQAKALVVTTMDPLDESDSPETVPGTAPQSGSSVVPNKLMESTGHGTDGTVTSGMDISTEPHSALLPTTTFSKKSGSHPPWEVNTTPFSMEPRGTTAPDPSDDLWENSSLMNKCLLAILLLALVAGLFMVCTAVLGTLLWRRVRTARRQLGPTEMICISSLLPDSERAANGPRRGIPVRHRLLVDASSEADGDNLTLSSFLPEHS